MAISKKQFDKRKAYLGSSDVAAIMGLDPFRNAYDVWLLKTNKLQEEEGENKVMKRGKYLEPAILNFAADELGPLELNPGNLEFTAPHYYMISHPDAMFGDLPIEAKSQGNYSKEVWGDDSTDQVPDRVIIQCHVHLICTGSKLCYVPVYRPYREFQMFHVDFDAEIADSIIEAAKHFWLEHVLKDVPPEDVVPALAVIKRIRREPQTIADISADLWGKYIEAQAKEKEAKAGKDKAQAELLAAIGTAEAGKCELGLVTYFETTRKAFRVAEAKYRTLKFEPIKETKDE
jgi:putative phage-type endonuclease